MGLDAVLAAAESLRVAEERGVLSALAARPCLAELARETELSERGLVPLLRVLAAVGVVRRDGDRFEPGPALEELELGPVRSVRRLLDFWALVPDLLESGTTARVMGESPSARASVYGDVVPRLASYFEAAAHELAQWLASVHPAPSGRVVDVGAGSAVWTVAMASREPGLEVVALDLPGVLPAARERAALAELSSRFSELPGDYHELKLPERAFDRIVVANVLHLETAEKAALLLRRLRPALRPEGRFIVVDAFEDGSATSEWLTAGYALHLALRTPNGEPHSEAAVRGWLSAVGLEEAERKNLDATAAPLAALVARAP
jgi:SAM-dependent methyltransferase